MAKPLRLKDMSAEQRAAYQLELDRIRARAMGQPLPAPPPKAKARKAIEEPRDGLAWLLKKRRLTSAQLREGMHYRAGFKDAGDVQLRSSMNIGVGDAASVGLPGPPVGAMTEARQEMMVIRYEVLRGQDDMLTAMDGVCGMAYTLRHLSGGDRHRADELEVALVIALDLIIGWRMTLKKAA